jgi:hypothetical protein
MFSGSGIKPVHHRLIWTAAPALVLSAILSNGATHVRAIGGPIAFETPSVVDPVHAYGEPDVALDGSGRVFASGPWGTGTQHSIWNGSVDGGHTFRIVNNQSPQKQYFADLAGAECIRTENTPDGGATVNQSQLGTCTATTPGADRQWLLVYDPPAGTPNRSAYTGPKPLAYMENTQDVSLLLLAAFGHRAWEYSNTIVDPTPGGPGLVWGNACPGCSATSGPAGANGDPAIDQVTGKVFDVNTSGGVSLNIGTPTATGTLCFLDDTSTGTSGACPNGSGLITIDSTHSVSGLLGPTMTLDQGRNLWVVWNSGFNIYVSVSPPDNDRWDQWRTTGFKVSNSLLGDKVDVFPWIKAGAAGRADVVWYGSDQTSGDPSSQLNQKWNAFMSQVVIPTLSDGSVDQTTAPSITEVKVSPHPVHYNDVCLSGTGCITNSPPGNRNLADFFQVNIDSTGAAEIVYDDTSNGLFQPGTEPNGNQNADHAGAALVTLARQNSGPGLFGTDVGGPSNAPAGSLGDPTGDALFPVIAGGTPASSNVPGMDLLGSSLDLSAGTLTVTMKVLDLTSQAVTAASVGAPLLQYITRWQVGNILYYAGMEDNPAAQGRQFFAGKVQSIDLCSVSGCTPHVLIYPEAVVSSPTSTVTLANPENGNVSCPATPSVATPCTITITVNASDVGSPTTNTLLEEVSAFSFAAEHPQAELTNAQAQADQNNLEIDGVCCYNYEASGIISTPEVPWTPALLGLGVAALMAGTAMRRRRSRSGSFDTPR